ncbi:MAG: preprotein translocase subunit SecG [Anaerohalosphaeraceae bacterium]
MSTTLAVMSFLTSVLMVLFLLVAVLLILVILIQKGKGGGLGAMFGGMGASSLLGSKTGDVLTWITISLVAAFLVLGVLLDKTLKVQARQVPSAAPAASAPSGSPEAPASSEQPGAPAAPAAETPAPAAPEAAKPSSPTPPAQNP